jgi:hypothetical protein
MINPNLSTNVEVLHEQMENLGNRYIRALELTYKLQRQLEESRQELKKLRVDKLLSLLRDYLC